MNSRFLLLLIAVAAFTSCSTAYKSGQTPDDVYYSPGRETAEYVEVRQERSGRYSGYEYDNSNDRWLRMRVRNPYRWNSFDDYDWNAYNGWSNTWNNPYSYNSNWNSYWNGYWTWNSYYNPYCWNTVVVNPKTNPLAYNKVRNFSLGGYTNTNYNNSNVVRSKTSQRVPGSGYGSYNNSNSNLGSSVRRVFNSGGGKDNGGTFSGSNSGSSSRTYNPSSSSSSSSSGSSTRSSSSGSTGSSGSSSSSSGGSGRRGG